MKVRVQLPISGISGFLSFAFLLFPPLSARAQSVVGTVTTGAGPRAVAVNPVTDKVYIAGTPIVGSPGGNVTVIDGTTDTTTTIQTGDLNGSIALAVNPVTNKIYVVNLGGGNTVRKNPGGIVEIDGSTNTPIQIPAEFPYAIAVNPVTNKIYVTGSQGVTVIDGATNSTMTVSDPNVTAIGLFPGAIAVNSKTNKIYVANIDNFEWSLSSKPGNVTVIDGATNSTTTLTDPNAVYPVSVAVNSTANKIYVVNRGDNLGPNHGNVSVIDGATNVIITLTDPNMLAPLAVAVNESTDTVYVANTNDEQNGNGSVTVIDGATNSISTVKDPNAIYPDAVAVDPLTNTIYVTNAGCHFLTGCSDPGSVTIIDGASNSTKTVIDPNANTPNAIAVNAVTDKVYVANLLSSNATVIDPSAAPTSYTLSVLLSGSRNGTVTSNPVGINCGTSCSLSFATGTAVMLVALPDSGSEFMGWSGACTGTGACNITMSTPELVTAAFTTPDFSFLAASTNLTTQRGGQVTDTLTVAPLNGVPLPRTIELSCAVTGSTPMAICALSPTSLTPGVNPATSTLTVAVPSQSAGLLPAGQAQASGPLYGVFLPVPLTLIGLGWVSGKLKQRRRRVWLLFGVFFGFVVLQTGCGGGSNSPPSRPQLNYTVTVTATAGAIQHSTQVAVTVQ